MEKQLKFGKGDQNNRIVERFQVPFSGNRIFLLKGVPKWPSQEII